MTYVLSEQLAQAHAALSERLSITPRIGIILGSGLGTATDAMEAATVLPYHEIPGLAMPAVVGHRGELAVGYLAGQPVAALRGRIHYYEGFSMHDIVLPVHLLHALGCTTLIVTNAAGGLHPEWATGDIMLMTNHIGLPLLVGDTPLRGPNDERVGPRFPEMLHPYDATLSRTALRVATEQGITLRQGVYVMVAGPSFETAAELRMLRMLGGDAVGMSTVPEVVAARYLGMRVVGLSLITNLALPDGTPASHTDVIDVGQSAGPRMQALLHALLHQIEPAA